MFHTCIAACLCTLSSWRTPHLHRAHSVGRERQEVGSRQPVAGKAGGRRFFCENWTRCYPYRLSRRAPIDGTGIPVRGPAPPRSPAHHHHHHHRRRRRGLQGSLSETPPRSLGSCLRVFRHSLRVLVSRDRAAKSVSRRPWRCWVCWYCHVAKRVEHSETMGYGGMERGGEA